MDDLFAMRPIAVAVARIVRPRRLPGTAEVKWSRWGLLKRRVSWWLQEWRETRRLRRETGWKMEASRR